MYTYERRMGRAKHQFRELIDAEMMPIRAQARGRADVSEKGTTTRALSHEEYRMTHTDLVLQG